MRKALAAIGAALLAIVGLMVMVVLQPASAATPAATAPGLHVSGQNVVESNGQTFVMRGINHEHVWFTNQTGSFANIKNYAHANTVRVVLGSGQRWGPSNDVANVVGLCKQNRLICVLEIADTTGYGEQAGAASLDQAVDYWIGHKADLVGQENYIIINVGNEPIGNNNPGQWTSAASNAIARLRAAGFQHLLMMDAPNWGQDWNFVMRDTAQSVEAADPMHNTVFSVHMYSVFNQASYISAYFDAFKAKNLPLVVGEFGYRFDSSQVDDEAVMSQAVARGIGYIGWSWAGNTDSRLDMTNNFNPNALSPWGSLIINDPNGIKATSKEATIYSGATGSPSPSTSPSPSSSPSSSPSASPSSSPSSGGGACTAAYSVANQWNGGFQGQVTVTAGSAPISNWTVTWAFPNGQSVTQIWSATEASSGSSVTAHNLSYNGSLAAGASTTFGFLGSWNGTNGVPSPVTCTAG